MNFSHHATLENPVSIMGKGIHSGLDVTMNLRPKETPGLVFVRTDLGNALVPVLPENLDQANRATRLRVSDVSVATPEHLLAALSGLGVTSLWIDIDREEVPILDGSAKMFVEKIHSGGRKVLSEALDPLIIKESISLKSDQGELSIDPSDRLVFSFTLSYVDSFVGVQNALFDVRENSFESDLAPARTFGFMSEVSFLQERGLALGGSFDNTLVILEDGYSSPLRFENELARHKILDMVGDLSILGRPIVGHVKGNRSGHALNMAMVKRLVS